METSKKVKMRNQHKDVLEYLKNHGSITQIDAYRCFPAPITRLSAVIFDLRKAGYNITDEWCSGFNCYGTKNFKKYILVSDEK